MKLFGLIFLSFLLLLLPSKAVRAQDFKLNGAVFEKGQNVRIALAEITNKRNRYSVGSNDIGLFTIKASIGDTLLIIKRGFNDMEVVVKAASDLIVYLNRGITLNEVVINGESKKQTLDNIRKDFKGKGSFYGGKPPFLSFLFSPLTAIYELIGKTPKNARRFNNYYQTEIQQTHIDGFFNKPIINKNTGLTGKELDDFMINYRPTYEQAKKWTSYDGLKWITDSYKKYADTVKKN
ncbi:MAG: hypothetical protein V4541_04855 [Bacteroidota bacterium]